MHKLMSQQTARRGQRQRLGSRTSRGEDVRSAPAYGFGSVCWWARCHRDGLCRHLLSGSKCIPINNDCQNFWPQWEEIRGLIKASSLPRTLTISEQGLTGQRVLKRSSIYISGAGSSHHRGVTNNLPSALAFLGFCFIVQLHCTLYRELTLIGSIIKLWWRVHSSLSIFDKEICLAHSTTVECWFDRGMPRGLKCCAHPGLCDTG